MLMKPSDFLQKNVIRRGSIHQVNLNREYQDLDHKKIVTHTVNKVRPCLVYSATEANVENTLVIPIKTKRESNAYGYEIYMDIMIKEGHESLLCISQMTLIPNKCICEDEMGIVKPSIMEKIDDLVDQFTGRKVISFKHPIEENIPEQEITEEETHQEESNVDAIELFQLFLEENYKKTTENRCRKYLTNIRSEFEKELNSLISEKDMRKAIKKAGYSIRKGTASRPGEYIANITSVSKTPKKEKKQDDNISSVSIQKKSKKTKTFFESLTDEKREEMKIDFMLYPKNRFMQKHGLSYFQYENVEKSFNDLGIYHKL